MRRNTRISRRARNRKAERRTDARTQQRRDNELRELEELNLEWWNEWLTAQQSQPRRSALYKVDPRLRGDKDALRRFEENARENAVYDALYITEHYPWLRQYPGWVYALAGDLNVEATTRDIRRKVYFAGYEPDEPGTGEGWRLDQEWALAAFETERPKTQQERFNERIASERRHNDEHVRTND